MSDITVKVEVGYGTSVAKTDDPLLCAKIMTLILESQNEAAANLTPEQTAIKALQEELDQVRTDLSTANYYRNTAQDELKELKAKHPEAQV